MSGGVIKVQVRFQRSSPSVGLHGWLDVGLRESMAPGSWLGGHVGGR